MLRKLLSQHQVDFIVGRLSLYVLLAISSIRKVLAPLTAWHDDPFSFSAREADPFVGGFVTWHIQDAANIEPGQFYAGVC